MNFIIISFKYLNVKYVRLTNQRIFINGSQKLENGDVAQRSTVETMKISTNLNVHKTMHMLLQNIYVKIFYHDIRWP